MVSEESGSPYQVRGAGGGLGLFAARAFRAGEAIEALGWGPFTEAPTRHSLQLGEARHAEPRPEALRYVNHSCAPTAAFDLGAGCLRALRPIGAGEPLTAFYPATEWRMAEPFGCGCGAPGCLGRIRGAVNLPGEALEGHLLSPFVRQQVRAARGPGS
jgi:hypothetical protein